MQSESRVHMWRKRVAKLAKDGPSVCMPIDVYIKLSGKHVNSIQARADMLVDPDAPDSDIEVITRLLARLRSNSELLMSALIKEYEDACRNYIVNLGAGDDTRLCATAGTASFSTNSEESSAVIVAFLQTRGFTHIVVDYDT